MHRDIRTDVHLEPSGSAQITTRVALHNEAPTSPPSLLIGPNSNEDKPGLNRSLLSVLMPPGAKATSMSEEGRSFDPLTYNDNGHQVAWDVIDVPAGATTDMTVTYEIPRALSLAGRGANLAFTLFPQATVNPDHYSLTLHAPQGYEVSNSDEVGAPRGPTLKQSGTLEEPTTIEALILKH